MAFMRGHYYIWDDTENIHLWSADGYDGWDESGWHISDDGADGKINGDHVREGQNTAGGVSIPQDVMDAYVVMRLAQLVYEGKLAATIDRVVEDGAFANVGGMLLRKNTTVLKEALFGITLKSAPPYTWDGS